MYKRIATGLLFGAWAILAASAGPAQAVELRFNAFADGTLGYNWGDPASQSDKEDQDAFGLSKFPLNLNEGFGIVGTDFVVTADLTDNLVYQGEINFQVRRGESSEIEIDVERFYLDYRISEALNVQGGLYFTPIGYHNRFLYSRAWLTYSLQVSDLFEEELNLIPTHTVGLNLHGTIHPMGQEFKYVLGIGNGRAADPTEGQYARSENLFDGDFEATALIEWHAPIDDTLILGFSTWTSGIRSTVPPGLGNTVDEDTAPASKMREVGINPYVTYFGSNFNVLLEGFWAQIHDRKSNLAKNNTDMGGITAEISLNLLDNKFHPYIRYDRTWLPSSSNDPYYGVRRDGSEITQNFVPESSIAMLGAAYDWNAHTRLKIEGAHRFTGPAKDSSIALQVAFGF